MRAVEKQIRDKKKRRESKRHTRHAATNAYDVMVEAMWLVMVFDVVAGCCRCWIQMINAWLANEGSSKRCRCRLMQRRRCIEVIEGSNCRCRSLFLHSIRHSST